MSSSNWNRAASDAKNATAQGTVAGYFANGEDAHRAINELVKEGFASDQIGAAFRSGARSGSSSASAGLAVNDLPIRPLGGPAGSDAGPNSDTHAVSPWGLSTGGGTPFAGASEPGPIPGSEIPSELPRELPSELASDAESRGGESVHDYAYSGSAFEGSISGMGIPAEQARRLSRELGLGGAVVTVKAGPKRSAADEILERNHGVIRYESLPSSMEETRSSGGEEERVRVFGEIHRVYPDHVSSHIPGEDLGRRKAS